MNRDRCPDRQIAAALGYRNTSSVPVACRRMEQAVADRPDLAATMARLAAGLSANH